VPPAESPNNRLASGLEAVKKIRLRPWNVATALMLLHGEDTRRSTLEYLAERSALVRAVVSVPRMAVQFVHAMADVDFPRTAHPDFWYEGAVIPLCERAIAKYCSQNGIQRLQELRDDARDTRLMAVGACALAAVMLQRSAGHVPASDPKWEQSVRVAEHLGFVVCNLGPDNTVEDCAAYPYTMAPALTLVALRLMRVPWVFVADWSSLETQAALQQTLRVVVACLTFSEGASIGGHWPSALRNHSVPHLTCVRGPKSILPLRWSSDTGPRFDPAGSSLEKVVVADFPTLEQTTPSTSVVWTPRPLISAPVASAPDVYGHRCFVQCKFSAPADPSKGLIADLEEEMRKAGLLQAPSDTGDTQAPGDLQLKLKQRLTCDLMLHHWRACERQHPTLLSDLKPPAFDQPSTVFDRYMYPLSGLTEGLVGKEFSTCARMRSDGDESQPAIRVSTEDDGAEEVPRLSTRTDRSDNLQRRDQQAAEDWVEFPVRRHALRATSPQALSAHLVSSSCTYGRTYGRRPRTSACSGRLRA
jgi:hypothetical protein